MTRPGAPWADPRSRGQRGVWGDSRQVLRGKAIQFVDLTFDEPRVLLVSGYCATQDMEFKVRTGIERAPLWETSAQIDKYSRVVVCRSLQVWVHNPSPVLDGDVQVVVVEIDATADVTNIIGTHPVPPQGQPNLPSIYRHTLDAAVFPLTSSFSGVHAPYYTRGYTITMNSPNGSRLYVAFEGNAALNSYSVILEDGQTYDTYYNGPMTAICDVADADPNAYVMVTSLGYSPALVPVYP